MVDHLADVCEEERTATLSYHSIKNDVKQRTNTVVRMTSFAGLVKGNENSTTLCEYP